jgi:hypothetical protein
MGVFRFREYTTILRNRRIAATINPEPAISLLTEHAANAVKTSLKTTDPDERVRAADDVVRHASALRDLGLSPDEVVDRIVNDATAKMTGLDDDGLRVMPERHELDLYVRRILSSLLNHRDE